MPNRSQIARAAWKKRKADPAYLAEQAERKDLVAAVKLLGVSRRWADLSIYDLRRLVRQTEAKKILYPQAVALGWRKHERQSTTEALDEYVKQARKAQQQKEARRTRTVVTAHRLAQDREFGDRLLDYSSIHLPSTHHDVLVRSTGTRARGLFSVTSFDVRPLPVTQSTFDSIAAFVRAKINAAVNRRSSPDNTVAARLLFYTSNPNSDDFDSTQQLPLTVDTAKFLSSAQVERRIVRLLNQHFNNDEYLAFFHRLELLERAAGGCNTSKPHTCQYALYRTGDGFKLKVHSVKSTNQNCSFGCFNEAFGLNGNKVKADSVRRDLSIPLGRPISLEDLPSILAWYNAREGKGLGLCVKHGDTDVLFIKAAGDKAQIDWSEYVRIFLHEGHYYTFEVHLTPEARTCPDCGVVYTRRHDKCDVQGAAFRQYRLSDDKDARNLIRVRKMHEQDQLDEEDLVYFKADCHKVGFLQRASSVSLLHGGRLYTFSGQDAIAQATDFLLTMRGKTVVGYSSSHQRELGHLHTELSRRPNEIKRQLMPQQRILELKFGDRMRVYDLVNYVPEGLAQAASSFRLESRLDGVSSNDVFVVRDLFRAVNGLIHGLEVRT